MPDEEETLDEFINAEYERIERFRKFWTESMKTDPELFPAKLPPGEWDEQYRAAEGV